MSVSPIPIIARGRGRPCSDDAETRTTLGQALHWLESRCFDISASAVRYRTLAEMRALHDAEHDRQVELAETLIIQGYRGEALAALRAAQLADEREDRICREGDGLVVAIHETAKRIAGWVERSCVALRRQS
jgi:predicted Zn-dependent protease